MAEDNFIPSGASVEIIRMIDTDKEKAPMFLRNAIGEGELEGRKFSISSGMDGSIHIEFKKQKNDASSLGKDRFIVKIRSVLEALAPIVVGAPKREANADTRR